MSQNTFGHIFKFHSFGESHGPALGAVIEGCPSGVSFSLDLLKKELDRRRPGRWPWTSSRVELDQPEILSGIYEGKTLGTPIAILVRNQGARSKDYESIKTKFRKGHADDLWKDKFQHVDHRGGGRSSGRETLSRVLAGSIARMLLQQLHKNFKVMAFVRQIGKIALEDSEFKIAEDLFQKKILSEEYPACFPHKEKSQKVSDLLMASKEQGESLASVVELWIEGVPKSLGQPIFWKFKSDLTQALMSLGASCGVEIGSGFSCLPIKGTVFHQDSKNYGGIRGGLTSGERVVVRVAFKAPSSLGSIAQQGRHDPCIGPRAVCVVEAIACLVIADHILLKRLDQI
ncbi:MAG: chorismate synthase [Bdellovibrionales bacterium]